MSNTSDLSEIFAPNGLLANAIQGYVYRSQQLNLVYAIDTTFTNRGILIAEAGTGTGKTFSYLIPALLNNTTTIISTGTKNLQNQLFFRDLPLVIKATKLPVRIALLKGRNNYLCKYRLEIALTDILLATSGMVQQLKSIIKWSESTHDGDTSTLEDVPEDSEVWRYVTSTSDNCLGQDCPFVSSCFVYKARQAALEAKIIVINHHLLFSDWTLKSENTDAELLPNGVNLVLDEAHQISEIATMYFGTAFSSKKIKDLILDITVEQKEYAKDLKELNNINPGITRLLEQIQNYLLTKPERGNYKQLISDGVFRKDLENCHELLEKLKTILEANSIRSKGLETCYIRSQQMLFDLNIFLKTSGSSSTEPLISGSVDWYEIYKHNFMLKRSPLDISAEFLKKIDLMAHSCVLTSATLGGANDFKLIKNDLGLQTAETMCISSPFDYKNNALLYLPRGMPDPQANNYNDCYINQVLPVLEASQGRAFLLFTSFASMRYVYDKFTDGKTTLSQEYNILMQGKASKTALLENFKIMSKAVLLATASFWEGIDVKGADLQCVIIDKLPFSSPTDPVLQAKIKRLREQGLDPFLDLQCQQAALQLTQGAGRLIRCEEDKGVLMLCDPRIVSRHYGKLFLEALPDMSRTRELHTVKKFYQRLNQKSDPVVDEETTN
ncbi:MAG: ATP-dependent DNA helicase [Gammaproteobacteria bacterium]|nr:ATP-dependent DNA helicase [Gammaproteobacteria bacterium]